MASHNNAIRKGKDEQPHFSFTEDICHSAGSGGQVAQVVPCQFQQQFLNCLLSLLQSSFVKLLYVRRTNNIPIASYSNFNEDTKVHHPSSPVPCYLMRKNCSLFGLIRSRLRLLYQGHKVQ